jgi:protein involved in polysaccharide export with SLBB domain
MTHSPNTLRLSHAAALLAALALLGSASAEERETPSLDSAVGGLGFSAQAAWLGASPPAPRSGGLRPVLKASPVVATRDADAGSGKQLLAMNSPRAETGVEVLVEEVELVRSRVARARARQPDVVAEIAPGELGELAEPVDRVTGGKLSWTERYELGPGDSLNFSLAGQPELTKHQVPVAPDWTISYLQAKRVSVRGLTVEELRVWMGEVLSEFHVNPKVIVTPAKLGSKKFTVLGKVKSNNTYQLDRPTSLIEAIARAKGIVVGVRNSSATELADLKRSFVVRDGEKLPVDFESLYSGGDMSQNIQIEPDDYIYIASNVHNETYVFGSVAQQGMLPLTGRLTVMGAIAESGGYAKYAWKKRVLVVRGSVGSPEATVIDTREVLRGNQKDLLLEPGDIVYVHREPWAYAEEILDIAIKAYIQSATAVAIQGDNAVTIGL